MPLHPDVIDAMVQGGATAESIAQAYRAAWDIEQRKRSAAAIEAGRAMQFSIDGRRVTPKDLSGACFVYVLVDPRNRRPFYVGISKNPRARFWQHCTDTGSGGWPLARELRNLGYGADRVLKVVKRCRDRRAAMEIEHRLITSTPNLLNRNNGASA